MSVISLEAKQAEKRVEEIKEFLLEVDLICDMLYNRLDYDGVWDSLMQLEDVRLQYYLEWHELNLLINKTRKQNEENEK